MKSIKLIFVYFVLAMSVLLVFWQVRNFDFVNYDDNEYVFENQRVLDGLTTEGVAWAFTSGHSANWHPMTWLSLMLDCQVFGAKPGGMHLVNVFFHLTNTLLLLVVLKKMTGAFWPSVFVAAAFGLHPMHVESVAWIAERKDVLSTFFLLLTLVAYAGYVKRPCAIRYFATLMIFALGLMAKPMLVTLPFVMLLLDYWPLNRFESVQHVKKSGRQVSQSVPVTNKHSILYRCIIEKIPFVGLSVVSSIVTVIVQRSSGAVVETDKFSFGIRLANAVLSYARYIGKMFVPADLAVFYPTSGIAFGQFALGVVLLIGVTMLVLFLGRWRKYLPVGWLWFVGTLVPVIGLVQVGAQAYADRYTYISYIGLFIMIAWAVPEFLSKWPHHKVVLGASMVIVLTALGICCHGQVSYWNNSISLFSRAIEVTENNCVAYNNLGAEYGKCGRYPEAIEAYKQAIKINPDYAKTYYNLGAAYGVLGRHKEAIEVYNQAIRIKPEYAEAYNNLGVAYHGLGRYEEAIEAYKSVIRIRPDAQAYNNIGIAYGVLGRYEEAAEAFGQAVRINPQFADAHLSLGMAYLEINDKTSAMGQYRILKALNKEMAEKLLNWIGK